MFVAVRDLRRYRVILYARQNYEKTFAIKIFARQVLLFMPKINKQQRHSAERPPQTVKKKNRLHRARARYAIFFPKNLSTLHLYSYSSGRKAFADERFGLQTRHSTPSQPFIAGAKPAMRDLLPAQAANAITWDNIRAHVRHFSLSPSKFFLSA